MWQLVQPQYSFFHFSSVWKEFEKDANIFTYLNLISQFCVFECLYLNPVHCSSNLRPAPLTVFAALALSLHPVQQPRIRMHLLFIQGHYHGGPSPPSPSPWSSDTSTLLSLLLSLLLLLLPGLRVLAGWVGAGGWKGGKLVAQLGLGGNLEADLRSEGLHVWTWRQRRVTQTVAGFHWRIEPFSLKKKSQTIPLFIIINYLLLRQLQIKGGHRSSCWNNFIGSGRARQPTDRWDAAEIYMHQIIFRWRRAVT